MRTIEREIVSAVILSRDKKILFGWPRPGSVYPNMWHLPGGGVDDGETRVLALRREVQEEVGIDIRPYEPLLLDDTKIGKTDKVLKDTGERVLCMMKFYDYKILISDKDAAEIPVVLQSDLVQYRWVALNELQSISLTPPSVALFRRIGYLN